MKPILVTTVLAAALVSMACDRHKPELMTFFVTTVPVSQHCC